MKYELLIPLNTIIEDSDELLVRTTLNEFQRQSVESIHSATVEMRDLIVSAPDFTWEMAQHVLSYETRSQLASIIGYAEMLLDGTEGDLDDIQFNLLREIRASGNLLYDRLSRLLD